MTTLFSFYWPVFVMALVLGAVGGAVAFRRPVGRRRNVPLAGGAAAALLIALAWHGPVGAGRGFATSVDRGVRIALDNYEMKQVSGRLERNPLRRRVILHGKANDFQQRELIRILNYVPGVGSVRWDRPLEPRRGL